MKTKKIILSRNCLLALPRLLLHFIPNKVIVRFSDFKTNEYCNLLGGEYFEPQEENPDDRLARRSRYYSEDYKEAFGLECKAIQKCGKKWDLTNVAVMIPFCRTVEELIKVKDTMEEYGLEQRKRRTGIISDGGTAFQYYYWPKNLQNISTGFPSAPMI